MPEGNEEYLTQEKFNELKEELDYLKTTRRKEIAESLEYARSLGDLSENAEYQEARDLQASTEERIRKVESVLQSAKIVSDKKSNVVGLGSTVTIQKEGDEVVVANRSWEGGIGSVWRVSWDGNTGTTHAVRTTIPARGGRVSLARPTSGGVTEARAAIRTDLGSHGLTAPETEAFMRAWDEALFGTAGATDRRTPVDEDGDDGVRADEPVLVDETDVDRLSDNIPAIQGGPRIADVVLYWLPRSNIDALAEVVAQPAPRNLRRAILVRADAR